MSHGKNGKDMAKEVSSQYHSGMKASHRPHAAPALALVLMMASAQALFAATLTVPELVSLLKAGVGEKVILAQVRASGPSPALSAEEIVQLKEAGASDELLEALVAGSSATAPSQVPKGGLRVFRSIGADGQEILNVTNLDEAGRRLGGELPPEPPRRAATPSSWSSPDAGREDSVRDAPIVVNVYPPASGSINGSEGGYDEGSLVRLGGVYPGYLALRGAGFCSRCPDSGRPHHRPAQVDEGGLFSRPPVIDTRPFRAHTAAQRNRIRFGN